jgi:2-polyprenyl-3-methyl-5-hydroxy-6-metoxy-1,4-benzoquinol methylase
METNSLLEDIFCLKYEMKALSDITLRRESERWIPGFLYKVTEEEHLDRYNYIINLTADKNILDIACGSGFGSYIIATEGNAKQVIGVDLDNDAIRYANHKFQHNKIKRFAEDAVKFKYKEKFDVIISFETIEHIQDYTAFINNLYDNLNENGKLVISTPIIPCTTNKPINPYHVIEWSYQDFTKLLSVHFNIEQIILQNICINTNHFEKRSLIKKIKNKITRIFIKSKSGVEYHKGLIHDVKNIDFSKLTSGYVICICNKK